MLSINLGALSDVKLTPLPFSNANIGLKTKEPPIFAGTKNTKT